MRRMKNQKWTIVSDRFWRGRGKECAKESEEPEEESLVVLMKLMLDISSWFLTRMLSVSIREIYVLFDRFVENYYLHEASP